MQPARPKKRFGQHFLEDEAVLARIVQVFAPRTDDVVIEIGPGEGALTTRLAGRLTALHVLEIDRDLCARLARDERLRNVHIHQGDALHDSICALAPGAGPVRLIGNLPYNISTPLLFRFLEQRACVRDMLFMFQQEVVDRIVAVPGDKDYGRLSVMVQLYCETFAMFGVPRSAFRPSPKVESAVVRLVPRETLPLALPQLAVFEAVVRQAFGQRRKTLRNSLRPLLDEPGLETIGIDPMRRPETLALDEFIAIAKAVHAPPFRA